MVQEGETTIENHKMAKLMGQIAEGLGVIDGALNGGSTKVTIKARLLDSFTRKENKTKQVQPWLHQVKAYMETQCLETNKEWIHFAQALLKEHMWKWWMFQNQETHDLLETLTWEEF